MKRARKLPGAEAMRNPSKQDLWEKATEPGSEAGAGPAVLGGKNMYFLWRFCEESQKHALEKCWSSDFQSDLTFFLVNIFSQIQK